MTARLGRFAIVAFAVGTAYNVFVRDLTLASAGFKSAIGVVAFVAVTCSFKWWGQRPSGDE